MILYKYYIKKTDEGYRYGSDQLDTEDDSGVSLKEAMDSFQFDKPVRIDIPSENMVVFLFNNELAFLSFEYGVYLSNNIDAVFTEVAGRLDEKKE